MNDIAETTDLLPFEQRRRADELPSVELRSNPIDGHGLRVMATTALVMGSVLTVVGFAIIGWWEPSRFGRADADVNRWFERRRTDTWTHVAEFASAFSDTMTVVMIGAVSIPLFLWLFRRWHDYALVFGGLIIEVTTFATVSAIVGRGRPPVEQLDGAPTNSFPSGHIAASVVLYAGLALVIFVQTRRRGARAAAVVVGLGVPSAVIASRLYLGMHYPTDAAGGVVLGVVILAVMTKTVMTNPVVHRSAQMSSAGR